MDHYLSLNGIKRNSKRARFSGRLGKNDELYVELPALNLRLYNCYRIKPIDLKQIVHSIQDWQLELIEGYPSMISTVSKFIIHSRETCLFPKLQMISTTAETLYESDRHMIEKAFNTKVYNQYASSEGSPFIGECKYGRLHLFLYSGILNKVKEKDKYVVTSFRSSKTRLVNYDIGDEFALDIDDYLIGSSCECGLIHPVIESIQGRRDDYILDENNLPIQRLDIIYKGLVGIVESQVIQNVPGTVVVKVVTDKNWNELNHIKLRHNLHNLLGKSIDVNIIIVDHIARSSNGKFRAVINNINKN